MPFRPVLRCLPPLLVSLMLYACADHSTPPQPVRFRLKQTISTSAIRANSKDTVIVTYRYNQQGNLDEEDYVHTNTSDPSLQLGYRSAFTYNAQNQLIRIDTRTTNNKTYLPNTYATRLTYTYDGEGRIQTETGATATLPDQNPADPYRISGVNTFSYNGSRFPATVTRQDGTTQSFTYSNGNLVQTNYTYDDKPNPYYGIIRGGGFTPRILSMNNALFQYPTDGKYKLVMTYNTAGLLTREEVIYTNPNETVYNYGSQKAFVYETY